MTRHPTQQPDPDEIRRRCEQIQRNWSPAERYRRAPWAFAAPYRGRYPCGPLVHHGIWYYGTCCLGPSAKFVHQGFGGNWPNPGPMPGLHISEDLGKTWQAPPNSPGKP